MGKVVVFDRTGKRVMEIPMRGPLYMEPVKVEDVLAAAKQAVVAAGLLNVEEAERVRVSIEE